jgi:UDP-N-acetyl-D-glucosamine dehydrogenase
MGKTLNRANVLVLGVAFKWDIDDARNSPAERVIEILLDRGAQVRYHDPYVPTFQVGDDVFHRGRVVLKSVPLTRTALRQSDVVVIVTGHRAVDYRMVVTHAPLIVDSVNATAGLGHAEKIVRLGAPLKTK